MFSERPLDSRLQDQHKVPNDLRQAQSLVAQVVEDLATEYLRLRTKDEHQVANQISVGISAPMLRGQSTLFMIGHKARLFISDLLIEVFKAYRPLRSVPTIETILTEYMLNPQRSERESFFARELLEHHIGQTPSRTSIKSECAPLSDYLSALRRTMVNPQPNQGNNGSNR